MFSIKMWKGIVILLLLISIPVIAQNGQDTTGIRQDTVQTLPDTTGADTTDMMPDTLDQGTNIRDIYKEYSEISQRLQTVQKQALSDIEVAEKTEQFTDKLESEMVKKDPSAKSKLERRDNIVNEFEKAEQDGNTDKMTQLQEEFQMISSDLQPLQQQVMADDNLREEGKELEETVFNKMTDIDPEVPKLFARLQTLGAQLQGQNTEQGNQNNRF